MAPNQLGNGTLLSPPHRVNCPLATCVAVCNFLLCLPILMSVQVHAVGEETDLLTATGTSFLNLAGAICLKVPLIL